MESQMINATTHITKTTHTTKQEQLVALVATQKILRARDLAAHGIGRDNLKRLVEDGALEQVGRGLYVATDAPLTEYQTLLEAMSRAPLGVIALASALRFHGLTTQNPWKVWMLIETGSRIPQSDYPPIVAFHAGGDSFQKGVDIHYIEGCEINVTSVAKTVADCFKYRNKIGLDVALEALEECLRERKATREEIRHYAGVCRVERVMKPYMEAYSR
jgi:predicted transcriptional regulator of viral defense system